MRCDGSLAKSIPTSRSIHGGTLGCTEVIERGESSPTVATLWNLTQALQVDFAGLLEGKPEPGIVVIRAAAAPVILGRGKSVSIRILSPAEAVGEHEVYDLSFGAGGALVIRRLRARRGFSLLA